MSKKKKYYSPDEYDWNADIHVSNNEIIIRRNGVYETVNRNKLRKLKIEEILKD
jgi:hypothetical protein